jgi:hypothetical protein
MSGLLVRQRPRVVTPTATATVRAQRHRLPALWRSLIPGVTGQAIAAEGHPIDLSAPYEGEAEPRHDAPGRSRVRQRHKDFFEPEFVEPGVQSVSRDVSSDTPEGRKENQREVWAFVLALESSPAGELSVDEHCPRRSVPSGRVPESDAVCEVAAYVTDDAVFG